MKGTADFHRWLSETPLKENSNKVMKNKLFIDDCRNPPNETWTLARTNTEAIRLLRSEIQWDIISIDHDIECPYLIDPNIKETFMPVAWFISLDNEYESRYFNTLMICHSWNDAARKEMCLMLSVERVINMPFNLEFYDQFE